MKTTYLTQVTTAFNPFALNCRVPRLFLTALKADAHKQILMKHTRLPRQDKITPASLHLIFKDGKKMDYTWQELSGKELEAAEQSEENKPAKLSDIVSEVERHTRILGRKEDLAG